MKIQKIYELFHTKYVGKMIIIKKGIFRIVLEKQAYFMHKVFHLKLTKLDNQTIKVGFPHTALEKWKSLFEQKGISCVFLEKTGENYEKIDMIKGKYFLEIFQIDLEDFLSTKKRVLQLFTLGIEEKEQKNFLLQIKTEEMYELFSSWMITLPKRKRQYLREKMEKLFLKILENIYKYKYNIGIRKELIGEIFNDILLVKEFYQYLQNITKTDKNALYLSLQNKLIELLQICKTLKAKA